MSIVSLEGWKRCQLRHEWKDQWRLIKDWIWGLHFLNGLKGYWNELIESYWNQMNYFCVLFYANGFKEIILPLA